MEPRQTPSVTSADLAARRVDYTLAGLDEADAGSDPIELFRRWYAEADALDEPNAMVLSTVGPGGVPAARTVLLKGLDDGFCLYTGSDSAKARELRENPRCALLFGWYALQRQVRVTGVAAPMERHESVAYFASRPRGSQLGAWASVEAGGQSAPVADRAALEAAYAEVERRFEGEAVPCPEQWGGWRVRPASIEFWQGRTGRMHDRLIFVRDGDRWARERLAP